MAPCKQSLRLVPKVFGLLGVIVVSVLVGSGLGAHDSEEKLGSNLDERDLQVQSEEKLGSNLDVETEENNTADVAPWFSTGYEEVDVEPDQVWANIYDVSLSPHMKRLNSMVPGGVYHIGIDVYGKEWGYGGGQGRRTGIYPKASKDQEPGAKTSDQHQFRESVLLGTTTLSEFEVAAQIKSWQQGHDWDRNAYELIQKNCFTFAREFANRLLPDGAIQIKKQAAYASKWMDLANMAGITQAKLSKWEKNAIAGGEAMGRAFAAMGGP